MQANPDSWEALLPAEKLKRLTRVLTKAGSDITYRDRCLMSPLSARKAVEEVAGVYFAPEMKVQFMNKDEAAKGLVLMLPDYVDPLGGAPIPRPADGKTVPCTYVIY